MRPAAFKAPLDYAFALLVAVIVIVCSFWVDPSGTHWAVLLAGIFMAVVVVAAALKPTRSS